MVESTQFWHRPESQEASSGLNFKETGIKWLCEAQLKTWGGDARVVYFASRASSHVLLYTLFAARSPHPFSMPCLLLIVYYQTSNACESGC